MQRFAPLKIGLPLTPGHGLRIARTLTVLLVIILLFSATHPVPAATGPWLGCLPMIAGQPGRSGLDIVEEEEEPLARPPATAGTMEKPARAADPGSSAPDAPGQSKPDAPGSSNPDAEEKPLDPSSAPPVKPPPAPTAPAGGGRLDDLLGLSIGDVGPVKTEVVCDIIHAYFGSDRGTPRNFYVKLLPERLSLPSKAGRQHEFLQVGRSGKANMVVRLPGEDIVRIEYYEHRMLERAATEFGVRPTELVQPDAEFVLEHPVRAKQAARAIIVLQIAVAEHDSAVQRYLRRGKDWTQWLRSPLVQALFNLQVSQVRTLIKQRRFRQAEVACERLEAQLGSDGPHAAALRALFEQTCILPAWEAAAARNYAVARELYDQYVARYPVPPNTEAAKFRDAMITKARQVVMEARREKDPRRQLELLEDAVKIWPELTGLEALRRDIIQDHPILECAYVRLPHNLSPLSARTPAERHAVSLMFEGLVRWIQDPETGPHYETELALGRPVPLARGRQFFLPRCTWSDSQDGEPHMCTVEDVHRTIGVLQRVQPEGFSPSWSRLIAGLDTSGKKDPFTVAIELERDYWQPLALMDFKVLPGHCFPANLEVKDELNAALKRFNSQPVGTGPYRFLDRDADRVRFVANSRYRKPGLPKIREIAFRRVDPNDFVDLFAQKKVHLIYGVRAEHVTQFEQQGIRPTALKTRSVCFLAPNVRRLRSKGLDLPDLRSAIAHAIDREKILNQFFRPGGRSTDHQALNGPFPQDCWATNPNIEPFGGTAQAQAHLSRAKQKLKGTIAPLTLVYPARDPEVESACKQIQTQLEPLGITLRLDSCEPEEFHEQIVGQHRFDLVYWRQDYEDETYWLWPLFDPDDRQQGGTNFMGYGFDDEFHGLFRRMKTHKHFPEIRRLMHEVHRYIHRRALLIPLWQLDTYVVVQRNVRNVTLDPVNLFGNIENWEIAQ